MFDATPDKLVYYTEFLNRTGDCSVDPGQCVLHIHPEGAEAEPGGKWKDKSVTMARLLHDRLAGETWVFDANQSCLGV